MKGTHVKAMLVQVLRKCLIFSHQITWRFALTLRFCFQKQMYSPEISVDRHQSSYTFLLFLSPLLHSSSDSYCPPDPRNTNEEPSHNYAFLNFKRSPVWEEFNYRPKAECQVGIQLLGQFSREAYTWITICFHVANKLLC